MRVKTSIFRGQYVKFQKKLTSYHGFNALYPVLGFGYCILIIC